MQRGTRYYFKMNACKNHSHCKVQKAQMLTIMSLLSRTNAPCAIIMMQQIGNILNMASMRQVSSTKFSCCAAHAVQHGSFT